MKRIDQIFKSYSEWHSLNSDVNGPFFLVPLVPIAAVVPAVFIRVDEVTEQAFAEVASKSFDGKVIAIVFGGGR